MEKRARLFPQLPLEIESIVAETLTYGDLLRMRRVCREWKDVVELAWFWEPIVTQNFAVNFKLGAKGITFITRPEDDWRKENTLLVIDVLAYKNLSLRIPPLVCPRIPPPIILKKINWRQRTSFKVYQRIKTYQKKLAVYQKLLKPLGRRKFWCTLMMCAVAFELYRLIVARDSTDDRLLNTVLAIRERNNEMSSLKRRIASLETDRDEYSTKKAKLDSEISIASRNTLMSTVRITN